MINRWLALTAGCIIQTVLGGIYAWSTFTPYLQKNYGLSMAQCGFIFGTTIFVFTSSMILAGRVLEKRGPRFTAALSALLFLTGYSTASLSGGSFPLLLTGISGIAGCGIGFGYVCPLSVGMKWFPEKRGMVTGVAVAGFGAGAILLSSIAEYFLMNSMDVLLFFRRYGLTAGLTLFAAALFLSEPPGRTAQKSGPVRLAAVFTWPFAINAAGLFAGTFAGLIIIGNLSSIVVESGFTEQHGALAVSLFAVGNGLGRIAWGRFFDQLRYKSIPLSLTGFAAAIALLLWPSGIWFFLFTIILLGFFFGANFVIYAAAISHYYGMASFPRLYPLVFMAYGVAGIIGPGTGGALAGLTGSYRLTIMLCIGLVTVTALLAFIKSSLFSKPPKGIAG